MKTLDPARLEPCGRPYIVKVLLTQHIGCCTEVEGDIVSIVVRGDLGGVILDDILLIVADQARRIAGVRHVVS